LSAFVPVHTLRIGGRRRRSCIRILQENALVTFLLLFSVERIRIASGDPLNQSKNQIISSFIIRVAIKAHFIGNFPEPISTNQYPEFLPIIHE